jgi:hypothetical protein
MTTTIARVQKPEASHYYLQDGTPFYEVDYADPRKGKRKTTLSDARKVNALPSVTTILSCLNRPALTSWLIEQSVLAVLTAPRNEGEELDAFIQRVLHSEKQQDSESQKARDLGTDVHAQIELAITGQVWDRAFKDYVEPAIKACEQFGVCDASEFVVVGQGYAGKVDAKFANGDITIVDFKTTKTLPKKSYTEHRLQLAAYAKALGNTGNTYVRTANIYISTKEPGKIATCISDECASDFERGFKPLIDYWQYANDYKP